MGPISLVPFNGSSVKGLYQEDIPKRPILADTQCSHGGQIEYFVKADGDVVLAGLGPDQLFHIDNLSGNILIQLYLTISMMADPIRSGPVGAGPRPGQTRLDQIRPDQIRLD